MKTVALAALASLPLALLVVGTGACGSSSASTSSSPASAAANVLHGAYVAVGDSASTAELRALVFYSDTGYFSYANNCTGASCRSQGSYVFDGKSDLALTDGTTHATRHLDFKAVESSSSAAGGLVGDLVTSTGTTPLVDGGAGGVSLLSTIIEALLDGILMALLGAGSDGGAGSGAYCDPIAAVIDCGLQGLSVQTSSNGSCSCGSSAPADAAAPSDASVTVTITTPPTPTAPSPQIIPLAVTNELATVQLSLGGGAPVTALLDTGSSGIWVKPGVIPTGMGTPSGQSIPQTYGNKVSLTGNVTSTTVTLGGVTSSMAVPVAEVASTTCLPNQTCNADVGGDPAQFLFNGVYPAIVGIGLRHPNAAGVDSPMPYLGQNGQHIVSLGVTGATSGSLIVDPSSDAIAAFDDNLVELDAGANDGWNDTQVPFCFNSFCGNALFDCGESLGILQTTADSDFADIGVATGSTTVPAATAVDIDVAGLDFSFTVGANPQIGVDSFRIQSTGAGNNLGIMAFRHFDFFYDDVAGVIGVAPNQ